MDNLKVALFLYDLCKNEESNENNGKYFFDVSYLCNFEFILIPKK